MKCWINKDAMTYLRSSTKCLATLWNDTGAMRRGVHKSIEFQELNILTNEELQAIKDLFYLYGKEDAEIDLIKY